MAYDNPERKTYSLAASAIATAGGKLTIVGPKGKDGRVSSVEAVITTATTDAATLIRVGDSATTAEYATLSVPIGAAAIAANEPVIVDVEIAADAVIYVNSDGGCTAGAADIAVTVDWF